MDRKSSQGYVIKLFGGLLAWRASKQDTVTTSTTEAELLASSQVAKETLYLMRFIEELHIVLPDPRITISCEINQTIRFVAEDVAKLQHVHIPNHWLRREVSRRKIMVTYVPIEKMLADGLTKSLLANKWKKYLNQLGLVERTQSPLEGFQLEDVQAQLEVLLVTKSTDGPAA
jgi:hypothetical protein